MHDPNNQQAAQEARLLGGYHRRTAKSSEFPGNLDNLDQLKSWLNSCLADTWLLENSVRRSTALASLLRIGVDVISANELDSKIRTLEGLIFEIKNGK